MQSRPVEIKALAGARALPPLMIVLYHFCDAHRYVPLSSVLGPPITKGYLWVEFFFALSGFILVHVYGGRPYQHREFLKARLARLYPVHLATLLTMPFLMWGLNALADYRGFVSIYEGASPPMNTWPSFLANVLLVQSWNILPGLTWNSAAWFVSIEFLLCLIFPIYLWLSHGGMGRGLALIAGGIVWLIVLSWNSHVGLDITFQNGAFRGMAGFAIGVGMATLFRGAKNPSIALAPEWTYSMAQAAVLVLLCCALYWGGPKHSRGDIWTALSLDALVFVLAFDKGFLARFLSTAPLQKLGEWSYGIYMGQTFWMQAVWQFDEQTYRYQNVQILGLRFGAWMWLLEPIVVLLVCIIWGALLARYVEQPTNAYLRHRFAQRKLLRTA